jgi:hypothetical protein
VDLLKPNENSAQLVSIMNAYQFSLLNNMKPTRSYNGYVSLIDHLFSNCQSSYRIADVIMPIEFSDHDAVFCNFDVKYKLPKDKWIFDRLYSEENWNVFIEILINESWADIYSEVLINLKAKLFMDRLTHLFDTAFPLKKTLIRGNKHNKVPLSEHTKNVQGELREFGERLKMIQDPEIKSAERKIFNSQKKYVGFCINNDVRKPNEKKIQQASNKGKAAWGIVNDIDGKARSNTSIKSLVIDGVNIEDTQEIVNHLNSQFLESIPNLDDVNSNYDGLRVPPLALLVGMAIVMIFLSILS